MAEFNPHGDTTVEVRGRTFVLHPHGDLNEEEVERLLREILTARTALSEGTWGILVAVESLVLLTSLAEQVSKRAIPGLLAAGLGAMAFVIPPRDRPLIEAQVRRVVAQSPCPINVFSAEDEAHAWLASVIGPQP